VDVLLVSGIRLNNFQPVAKGYTWLLQMPVLLNGYNTRTIFDCQAGSTAQQHSLLDKQTPDDDYLVTMGKQNVTERS
jgi:hypothetical protein